MCLKTRCDGKFYNFFVFLSAFKQGLEFMCAQRSHRKML